MIKKFCSSLFIWFTLLMLVVNCSGMGNSARDDAFRQYLPYSEVNTKIRLSMPESLGNRLKIGDWVSVMVTNHTQGEIAFPPDYGLKLYIYQEEEWVEVENNMTYVPNEEKYLPPEGVYGFRIVNFTPCVPVPEDRSSPAHLRVLVVGTTIPEGDEAAEKVAAYYDVVLHP